MPKTDLPFDPDDYAPVAERIALFYARHPEGRIVTELLSPIESVEVVVRACVYRAQGDVLPAATGLAAERKGDGDVNAVACLENTETSAIGRALANLGLTASRQRPSREEMRKAARGRRPLTAPGEERRQGDEAGARPRAPVVGEQPVALDPALQERAGAVMDALHLLATAERYGLTLAEVSETRAQLTGPGAPVLSLAAIAQIERRLRRWLARRSDAGPVRPSATDERPSP